MSFKQEKIDALNREDRSSKGSIDEKIRPLCDTINSMPDFYTTSSCSGRISISSRPGNKYDFRWIFVSHDPVDRNILLQALEELPSYDVWFCFEPFILHVAAESLRSAEKILRSAHAAGLKRAGIISIAPEKIMIEIIGNEKLDTPIGKHRKLLINEDYLSELISTANIKMKKNSAAMGAFHRQLSGSD